MALRHPAGTCGLWTLWLLVSVAGLARLDIDTSTATFLDRSDAAWLTYQESVRRFGGDEFLVVALEVPEGLDPTALKRVARISDALLGIQGVRRVDSVATVNLLRHDANGAIRFGPLVVKNLPSDPRDWSRLLADIRADPVVPGGLMSRDERVFALNVFLDEDVDSDRATTVREIERIVSDQHAFVSGVPIFRTAVNSRTSREVALFVPVTVAVIAALLLLALRSPVAATVPIAIGGIGSLSALGVMGWVGVPLSLSTLILPSILLALGCAYSVHVVFVLRSSPASDRGQALVLVAEPVALSGLTTVIGFLAMATVRIDAIRELATYGAVGVFATTAASLTLLPAIVRRIGPTTSPFDDWVRGPCARTLEALLAWRGPVLGLWAMGLVISVIGLHYLAVSTDIILWFHPGSEIRQDYETIRGDLSGITPVNIVVASESDDLVTGPRVVAAIGALTDAVQALPYVGKALSIAGPLARLNGMIRGEGSSAVPTDASGIQQLLLVLESAPYIHDLVTVDQRSANVVIRVNSNSSRQIVKLKDWVDGWWRKHGVAGFSAKTTGIMFEFGRSEEEIAYGQIRGLGLAVAAIFGVLLILLRSWSAALVALVPNVVPLGIAFGTMGFTRVPLDAATVCLGSLSLGIAVDDTIHLLVAYRFYRGGGAGPREAVAAAFHRVLPAVVLTSAVCGFGFLVLVSSNFTLIQNLGWVTAAMMLLCLLADVTLLPALLTLGRGVASAEREEGGASH